MSASWLSAAEAAKILESRGISPDEAISAIVRETGVHGMNLYWAIANSVSIRGGAGNRWLTSPAIDLSAGTIVVPTRAPGRRLPQDIREPLLISSAEIDRRWPNKSVALKPKRKVGRPVKIDEYTLEGLLEQKFEDEGGPPSPENPVGWQRQADVELFITNVLAAKGTPLQESAVRSRASAFLKQFGPKADN